jgi:mitochondrial import receptor subunit TOM70
VSPSPPSTQSVRLALTLGKVDPECDIAVATMAQLLLQQGKITEALKYFRRAAELARTEGELVSALSYAEAASTQLKVQENYPELAQQMRANIDERPMHWG